jgi:hypothetical protein
MESVAQQLQMNPPRISERGYHEAAQGAFEASEDSSEFLSTEQLQVKSLFIHDYTFFLLALNSYNVPQNEGHGENRSEAVDTYYGQLLNRSRDTTKTRGIQKSNVNDLRQTII